MTTPSSTAALRRGCAKRLLLDFSVLGPGGSRTYAQGFLRALVSLLPSLVGENAMSVSVLLPVDQLTDEANGLHSAGGTVAYTAATSPGTWKARAAPQIGVPWWCWRLRATHVFVPREVANPFISGRLTILARNVLIWLPPKLSLEAQVRLTAARLALRRANSVIAPSETFARVLPRSDIAVIHYGSEVPPVSVSSKSRCRLAGGREIRILCLGTVWHHKRFDVAIRAAAMLSDKGVAVRLDIWGDCPDYRLAGELRRLGHRLLGYDPLKGVLAPDDRSDVFRQSDVLFVGSSTESFGHSVVEAMRTSTVVLAPDSPLVRELCGDAAATYTETSHEDAVDTIIGTLGSLHKVAKIGYTVGKQFTWERCVCSTLKEILGPQDQPLGP